MKIIHFFQASKCLVVKLPNYNIHPESRDAKLYGNIMLWHEDSDEIQNIQENMRQKWSDAALKDRTEISADEIMELLSVRGMDITVE